MSSLTDLVALFGAHNEAQGAILDNVRSCQDDSQQTPRLKRAWRFAHDKFERRSSLRPQDWAFAFFWAAMPAVSVMSDAALQPASNIERDLLLSFCLFSFLVFP